MSHLTMDSSTFGDRGVHLIGYGLDRSNPEAPRFTLKRVRAPLDVLLDYELGPACGPDPTFASVREGRLVKIGPDTWLRRSRAPLLCRLENEALLPAGALPVTEKLFASRKGFHFLPLDGPPRRLDRDEAIARFADASCGPAINPMMYWPPPLPPIAVLVRSGDDPKDAFGQAIDRAGEATFASLLRRPAFILRSFDASIQLAALDGVPAIRSSALHDFVGLRSLDWVFHPARHPALTMTPWREAPRIIFGHPDPAWASLLHLTRGQS